MNHSISEPIVQFLRRQTGIESLDAESDWFDLGVLESLMVIDLACFVETRFRVSLGVRDLTPENLRTIAALAGTVARRLPSLVALPTPPPSSSGTVNPVA